MEKCVTAEWFYWYNNILNTTHGGRSWRYGLPTKYLRGSTILYKNRASIGLVKKVLKQNVTPVNAIFGGRSWRYGLPIRYFQEPKGFYVKTMQAEGWWNRYSNKTTKIQHHNTRRMIATQCPHVSSILHPSQPVGSLLSQIWTHNLFISIISLLNIVLKSYIFTCVLFLVFSQNFCDNINDIGDVMLYGSTKTQYPSRGIVVVCVEVEGGAKKAAICYDGNVTFNEGAAAAACRQRSFSSHSNYGSGFE